MKSTEPLSQAARTKAIPRTADRWTVAADEGDGDGQNVEAFHAWPATRFTQVGLATQGICHPIFSAEDKLPSLGTRLRVDS